MTYRLFDGRRVNGDWFVFLTLARHDGVPFRLNQGKRTISEQWHFWRIYRRNGWPLAAFPSPRAPHVRDDADHPHAIDADNLQALIDYGACHGVVIERTVPGEEWHGEARPAGLRAFARRHGAGLIALPVRRGSKGRIVKDVQVWLRRGRYLKLPASGEFGPHTDTAVRAFQRHVRLQADGVVGAKTYAALRRRFSWRVWRGR